MKRNTSYRTILAASAAAVTLGFAPFADAGINGGRNQASASAQKVYRAQAPTYTPAQAQPTRFSAVTRSSTQRTTISQSAINRGHHVGRGVAANGVRHRTASSDFSLDKLFGSEG
ncbi:MAG: hypothetical protein AAGB29_10230 [Planctomycetota bacterium]